jgi:hypothetical protein
LQKIHLYDGFKHLFHQHLINIKNSANALLRSLALLVLLSSSLFSQAWNICGDIPYDTFGEKMDHCIEPNTDHIGVALRIFVIRKSDGTGSIVDENYLNMLYKEIDEAFNPHQIYPLLSCVNYIDDSFIFENVNPNNFADFVFNSGFKDPDFVTLIIHGGVVSGGRARSRGDNIAISAAGYFDDVSETYISPVIHELGHLFGLSHTHAGNGQGGSTPDLVDGSTCCTAGDRICDTPPDPFVFASQGSGGSDDGCVWIPSPGLVDANGDMYVNVDVNNHMSYYIGQCADRRFSPEQGNVMRATISTGEGHLFTKRPDALFFELKTILGDIEYDTDVRVLSSGKALFRNGTVSMPPFRKIAVDGKGILSGVNSTFTVGDKGCGVIYPFWRGIELATTDGSDPNSQNGLLSMIDATIEFANEGVSYGSTFTNNTLLPRIFMLGTNFINNRVALSLNNSSFSNSPENQYNWHWLSDCNFVTNEDYPQETLPVSSAIKIGYSNPFHCWGCNFEIPELKPSFNVVPAIHVIGSKLIVERHSVQGTTEMVNSSFMNYQLGILLTNSDYSSVSYADFNNVQHGISANDSPSLSVRNSKFNINNQNFLNGYAIRMNRSSSFFIDQNEFINTEATVVNSRAMQVDNAGEPDAFIVNNLFKNFAKEVVWPRGLNAGVADLTGLRILCNDFRNPDPNSLRGPFDIGVNTGATIAEFQGGAIIPAGNKFSSELVSSSSNYSNEGPGVVEYFYSVAPNEERPIPFQPVNVNLIEIDKVSECIDFGDESGFSGGDFPSLISIAQEIGSLNDELSATTGGPQRRKIRLKLNDKQLMLSLALAQREREIEGDSLNTNKLAELLQLTPYRSGYAADFQESLLKSRYGGFADHRNFVTNAINTSDYDLDFRQGITGYADALSILSGPSSGKNLKQLTSQDLESLVELGKNSSGKMGGDFTSSFLASYYDMALPAKQEKSIDEANIEPVENISSSIGGERIFAYPNPATEVVWIKNLKAGQTIILLDINGRVLMSKAANNSSVSFDLTTQPNGIYYYQVFDDKVLVKGARIIRQ